MRIKTLYKYERELGKTTISPEKPDCAYTEMYRIIAADGMYVTLDGVDLYSVVDTDIKDGWYEVEEVIDENDDM
jgi:hypothetical protein